MKIRPVILCGGAGTRLWPNSKKHQAKQFIDFGGWTLFGKTLERVKNSIFDYPIISTNHKYIKDIKKTLNKYKIKKYKIVLEPTKKNTGPAILATALIKDIPQKQPMIFLTADHGNSDFLVNADGSPNTAHSKYLVPWFLIGDDVPAIKSGKLGDVAPTILKLMGLEIPSEMTGEILV